MKKDRFIYAALFLLLVSDAAWAEQDFFGIQMKNEEWARSLVLNKGYPDLADLSEGPVLDHSVYAEASLKELPGNRIDFRVTVFNDSASAIPTNYRFRDFLVYVRGGKKYFLVDTEEDAPSFVDPRSKASFAPSFGGLSVRNSEVEMIVCSFDLGRTKIILFPWSKKEIVSKVVSPKLPKAPAPTPAPAPVKKTAPPSGPRKKTPKRDFWDWAALKKPVKPTTVDYRVAAPAPRVPEGAASPSTQKQLDSAIQNFVYTPSGDASPARREAHVVGFDKSYNLVTFNLGEQDGLHAGMTLSILREGKLMAKATVRQVRAAVAAATLVPETIQGEVHAGDAVTFV